jgi:hypothetical protein
MGLQTAVPFVTVPYYFTVDLPTPPTSLGHEVHDLCFAGRIPSNKLHELLPDQWKLA